MYWLRTCGISLILLLMELPCSPALQRAALWRCRIMFFVLLSKSGLQTTEEDVNTVTLGLAASWPFWKAHSVLQQLLQGWQGDRRDELTGLSRLLRVRFFVLYGNNFCQNGKFIVRYFLCLQNENVNPRSVWMCLLLQAMGGASFVPRCPIVFSSVWTQSQAALLTCGSRNMSQKTNNKASNKLIKVSNIWGLTSTFLKYLCYPNFCLCCVNIVNVSIFSCVSFHICECT